MQATDAFFALSQPTRLDIFRTLIQAGAHGRLPGEIATTLGLRLNTLSNNLSILLKAGLITRRREGRNLRYTANTEDIRELLSFLLEGCCQSRPDLCHPLLERAAHRQTARMGRQSYTVLFLCTGNSARSLMAEAILNREGQGRFVAHSAGSRPADSPHPEVVRLLSNLGHDVARLRSKSWGEFIAPDAPKLDFVFSVCDSAAAEICPVWPGQPMAAHWGVPDPAGASGTEAERQLGFSEAYRMLRSRILSFVSLPVATLDQLALQRRLDDIGQIRKLSDEV